MNLKNEHKHKDDHYDCDDIERLVQKYVDGQLNQNEMQLFEEHLEYCLPCDKKIKFEFQLKEVVRLKARENVPVDQLKSKMKNIFKDLD